MRILLTGLLVCSLTPLALAQNKRLTGKDIVRRADSDHKAKDESGAVSMVLVTKKGKSEKRSMKILFKQGDGEDDKHCLRFLSPAPVRNLALLTHEASGRSDDQWVWIPGYKKLKRVAASRRTDRFGGTDFTYEDLRTEDFSGWRYTRKSDAEITKRKIPCFVVEASPKSGHSSGYSRRLIYVEKKRFLVLRVKLYDRKGRHHKTLIQRDYEQVNAHWRPKQSMMIDHLRDSRTIWRFTKRVINAGIADRHFRPESLGRG